MNVFTQKKLRWIRPTQDVEKQLCSVRCSVLKTLQVESVMLIRQFGDGQVPYVYGAHSLGGLLEGVRVIFIVDPANKSSWTLRLYINT